MIAAIIWLVGKITKRAPRDAAMARVITKIKRDQYDLNPALRVRTRIPKVGRL